ncbi:hypothetical protein K461DRAFT_312932 [Myriangium duriaei CBS 260.36]|uniref:Zn(2)-C6 fungal-type domain-containing protein n=1 Tax=Myriangium duriaei CBS 260.36 TaxID=1168546 RepID=A0A9P4J334_9PEZI|nr:hypothetical protein K461DRAFT_312932 [Myriangium duriaei CBS 260.36]
MQGRPYRSHVRPACGSCRKRKSRCTITGSSRVCLMCQAHGTECVFMGSAGSNCQKRARTSGNSAEAPDIFVRSIDTSVNSAVAYAPNARSSPTAPLSQPTPVVRTPSQPRSRRQNHASAIVTAEQDSVTTTNFEEPVSALNAIFAESGDHSTHVVSPAIANDNDELESYLSNNPNTGKRRITHTLSHSTMTDRPSRPVLFNTVIRRPLGVNANQSLAASKCELIEKLLGPHVMDVVDLFFENAGICLPVLDERSFRRLYTDHKEKLSPALVANLYANAITYWHNSPRLRARSPPDHRFIWVQANEALNSELFLSPGISTVISIVLNVCGRPSTSIFGNGGLVGTAVALTNALGLNRDPSKWNISPSEKTFRIRIWWLVVMLDRWCSLAHGTPLQIHRAQHDVPMLSKELLCESDASTSQTMGTSVFLALLTLTEVLGRYLENIYCVSKSPSAHSSMSSVELELLLTGWEDTLDDDIRRLAIRGVCLDMPGAANFRLAYLAVKLVLRRIQCDSAKSLMQTEEAVAYASLQAQRVTEEIVHHIQELQEIHLKGYWLQMNAFTLTSGTTFLLRTALKPTNTAKNTSLKLAKDMINALMKYRTQFRWDLADDCLANCADMIEKIEAGNDPMAAELADFQEFVNTNALMMDDAFMGFGSTFETDLWDI